MKKIALVFEGINYVTFIVVYKATTQNKEKTFPKIKLIRIMLSNTRTYFVPLYHQIPFGLLKFHKAIN